MLPQDALAHVGVGEHGVGGHHRAREREYAEQSERGLVFVRGRLHPHLGDHRRRLRGVRGEQVNARRVAVAGSAEDLAVEGDVVPAVGVPVGQPVAEDPVQVVGVEGGEQIREGVGTRHVAVAEAEGVAQAVPAEASELGDGGDRGVAGQGGHQGQREQRHQRILPTVPGSRVGQFGQAVEQREGGHQQAPCVETSRYLTRPTSPTSTAE